MERRTTERGEREREEGEERTRRERERTLVVGGRGEEEAECFSMLRVTRHAWACAAGRSRVVRTWHRHFGASAEQLRNVAIVAHVDHGKTTLVDALLKAAKEGGHTNLNDREMDSDPLEKERGITILSKSTSMAYKDWHINIVDTPGHTDFGGEVERVLSMVDGVCLLVDATDGPMPQSKFVLSKALEKKLRPIVVINKIDRPTARIQDVENEVFDLFCSLNASDDQLEYPTVYAVGRDGWASLSLPELADDQEGYQSMKFENDVNPLLDTIVERIPAPSIEDGGFRMLVTMMESDPSVHLGKLLLTGRILSGTLRVGDKVSVLKPEGDKAGESTVLKMFKRVGTKRYEISDASAGDIVTLAGVADARATDTLCAPEEEEAGPVPGPRLDPPTLSMFFSVNDSPLAGHPTESGGSKLTSQLLQERLLKETESNVAVAVNTGIQVDGRDCFEVQGRGEMQLGILVENMRREGFELSVSPPRALMKRDEDGKRLEPIEECVVDVAEEHAGQVIEIMMNRKAEMVDTGPSEDGTRRKSVFKVPTRGTVGLRGELVRLARGDVIFSSVFDSYEPHKGALGDVRKGVLVASEAGETTTYALGALEARGNMFLDAGTAVYQGMIIGEASRSADLDVNPNKQKKLTNIRAAGKDETIRLTPPTLMTLEESIGYIQEDELLEVTPKAIRMRKTFLTPASRKRNKN